MKVRTSLVVHLLRTHLPTQGHSGRPWFSNIPRAEEQPASVPATEPASGACKPQLRTPRGLEHLSSTRKAPEWEALALQLESSPYLLPPEKVCNSNEGPVQQ